MNDIRRYPDWIRARQSGPRYSPAPFGAISLSNIRKEDIRQMSHQQVTAPPAMPERPTSFPANGLVAVPRQDGAGSLLAGPMGPLELAAYKTDWRTSLRFRRHVAAAAAAREHKLLVKKLQEEARLAAWNALRAAGKPASALEEFRKGTQSGAREPEQQEESDLPDSPVKRRILPPSHPVTAARVAARLLAARLFDLRPDLRESIRSSAPVIAIDVPDGEMLDRVLATWEDAALPGGRVMKVGSHAGPREDYDVVHIAAKEPPKAAEKAKRETEALSALSLALPIIAISPAAETHLAEALLKSAPVRIAFPGLDAVTIARVIRIITGKPCRELLDRDIVARLTPVEAIVAVRFGRTPAECMAELRRLAAAKAERKGGRDITLDELHGMDEAVAWARSTIRDLEAWRRGTLPWSALDAGACLVGPSGTGKTLFAQVFAEACSLPLVACSLANWQGSDEGHLGHLLRAMKRDFDTARACNCIVYIDEIDSFADRSKVRHAHSDYVVEVVNGFLMQLDGVAGREGIIFLASSNDLSRCDPAILRSGRLNRIIQIGLPTAPELERMFRVRLAGRLAGEDLQEICLLALGSTGADVERITKDAARFARHEQRQMEIVDLRRALVDVDDRDMASIECAAVHEAGHLLVEVVLLAEPEQVHATIAVLNGTGGTTMRIKTPPFAGTYADYVVRLQILLAGRAAEEIVRSGPSHGAGGRRGSDLQRATALAAAMVASVGLAGPSPLLFLGTLDDTTELLSYFDVRKAAHAELAKAAESCRAILLEHRAALEEMTARLLSAGRLDGVTAAAIIDAHRQSRAAP
jgi:cell division protease FtsH